MKCCYFCNKSEKIVLQKRTLWNGKQVAQCVWCFKALETGLKIAKERGFYDEKQLQLSISKKPTTSSGEVGDGRYGTMKVTKGATGGSNLKATFVEEKKIANVKISDEGEYVTYKARKEGEKDSTKLVLGITYDGQSSSDPDRWSMNNKSMNTLIEKWGDDTAVWVGKQVEINLEGVGEYRHIVVDAIRTK